MRPALRAVAAVGGREAKGAFGSAFGWGLAAGFLAVAGVLGIVSLRAGQARLDDWFLPLYVLMGVLAPLVAMRSFAEEERAGSLDLLLAAPIPRWTVVVGKVCGVGAVLVAVVAGTVTTPVMLAAVGNPDPGPLVTGYVGLALVGLAFAAVGVAASAMTSSQLIAAVAASGLLLGTWFSGAVVDLVGAPWNGIVEWLAPSSHVVGFLRGTLAPADVAYFVTVAATGVAVTLAGLTTRR